MQKSKPPKTDSKPTTKHDSKPTTKQTKKKPKKESESKYLSDSELVDKVKFKAAFPDWCKDKLA